MGAGRYGNAPAVMKPLSEQPNIERMHEQERSRSSRSYEGGAGGRISTENTKSDKD